jgi:hypothetical protein
MIQSYIFELDRQARPSGQTGIRLYRPLLAEGQNYSWGHRSQPMQLHIKEEIYTRNKHLPMLDPMVFL